MALHPGDEAPQFCLYDSEKNKVSLENYKGSSVLLLFFPFAFSSVCTKELCNIRDNLSIYNDYNANILGISVDSLYTLAKFKADQNLSFPLLSDFNKEVSKSYDVLYETFPSYGMQGVSKRAAVVIDGEGIIRYVEIAAVPANLPDFEAIQSALADLN